MVKKCCAYLFITYAIALLKTNAFVTRPIFQCCVSEIATHKL